ncbi:glucose-6-phosphate dehydrogenase [Methylacidiphilum sp. Yel]|jgi:glucose-6-phosphate 1-dehydrogenase|uniref:glucose-6-phosphate dehydrogenase n=1 Tax=Methylacidiphilum sp. Yel TaxID=1847730 RepID=UPI00106B6E9C|nr:glucose-6-phosphate dehydrogenase [Methylacidiphilum sp. Yel]TFE65809.1 glucose-6-phosphate dehydrogenase [Methylacidiphilum sp. Yel]
MQSHKAHRSTTFVYPAKIDPTAVVIFGATGDLTKRKIIPAFYHLRKHGRLPDHFVIVGFARRPYGEKEFRALLKQSLEDYSHTHPIDPEVWRWLEERIFYLQGDLANPEDYVKLAHLLNSLPESKYYKDNHLFYLATAPKYFPIVSENLAKAGLNPQPGISGQRRLIVEKPFGTDLKSARELNSILQKYFPEKSIFRIDHYLGKETVQNLLYFRFGNSIFEPLWDRKYIDHVQITVAETQTIGSRGEYYDATGASRDMLQNHLMQLFSLIAMEPPASLEAESIRDEKVKVLKSVPIPSSEEWLHNSVRAQYGPGILGGKTIKAYREEDKVSKNSLTETYVCVKLEIDNWRWSGVPFYLRTGKALAKQFSEICIVFNRPPCVLFANSTKKVARNWLKIRIQPNEGIHLLFNTKVPNLPALQEAKMDFYYRRYGDHYFPEAYERLLLDALNGESTLFTRSDEVEYAWKIIDALRNAWNEEEVDSIPLYAPGSMGPVEADELLRRDGRYWGPPPKEEEEIQEAES